MELNRGISRHVVINVDIRPVPRPFHLAPDPRFPRRRTACAAAGGATLHVIAALARLPPTARRSFGIPNRVPNEIACRDGLAAGWLVAVVDTIRFVVCAADAWSPIHFPIKRGQLFTLVPGLTEIRIMTRGVALVVLRGDL